MKTTLHISDPLLEQIRRLAAEEGQTLRALVEQGLRKVLADRASRARPFRLKDCSVGTPGTSSPYEQLAGREKRSLMYDGGDE